VSDPFRPLSDDEVAKIRLLIESLDRSTLDFLHLEFGDVKLMIGKGAPPPADGAAPVTAITPRSGNPAGSFTVAPERPASPVQRARIESAADDMVAITAPMIGRFYAQREPGAPPFVAVGSEVTEDTTVAIIEVMKMFNSIPAGVRGVIAEICAQDSQFVEYGQVLFRVRPAGPVPPV
jgi:acetyl-CoA carboxylase biotin carboxyl carrier protein